MNSVAFMAGRHLHHRELVRSAAALGFFQGQAGTTFLFRLQAFLQLHSVAVGRPHPPAGGSPLLLEENASPTHRLSHDSVAVWTHRLLPSGALVVEVVGMDWRHLSWQRGATPRPTKPATESSPFSNECRTPSAIANSISTWPALKREMLTTLRNVRE